MDALFTALFATLLVPAPPAEEAPLTPAPAVQHLKYSNGSFETTVAVAVHVPVTEAVQVNVNGKVEVRTVIRHKVEFKVEKQLIDAKGTEVFTLDNKKLPEAEWQKALADGAVVLVVRDGQLPAPAFRKIFKDGTLIVSLAGSKPMPGPVNPVKTLPPAPLPLPAPPVKD